MEAQLSNPVSRSVTVAGDGPDLQALEAALTLQKSSANNVAFLQATLHLFKSGGQDFGFREGGLSDDAGAWSPQPPAAWFRDASGPPAAGAWFPAAAGRDKPHSFSVNMGKKNVGPLDKLAGVKEDVLTLRWRATFQFLTFSEASVRTVSEMGSTQRIKIITLPDENVTEIDLPVPLCKFADRRRGLLSTLGSARDNPDLSDFVLHCGGQAFPVSRFVLGARSPVFRAMFSHAGTEEASSGQAVIEDCTPGALGVFLELLYIGQAESLECHARFLWQSFHFFS